MLQVRKCRALLLASTNKMKSRCLSCARCFETNFFPPHSLFLPYCFHCCFSSKQCNLLSSLTRMHFPQLSIVPHWFIPTTLMFTAFKLHLVIRMRHEALLGHCFFCLNCRWCGIEACFSHTGLQPTASLPITHSELYEVSFPIWITAQANVADSRMSVWCKAVEGWSKRHTWGPGLWLLW